MATTNPLLCEYFNPLLNLPCWTVTAEYGSWLSSNFGHPELAVREGNPASAVKSLQRRSVFVNGQFLLWIEMGAWDIIEGEKRLFHSEQTRAHLRRAAGLLNAQKLVRVQMDAASRVCIFTFEFDSQLRVRPTYRCSRQTPFGKAGSPTNANLRHILLRCA